MAAGPAPVAAEAPSPPPRVSLRSRGAAVNTVVGLLVVGVIALSWSKTGFSPRALADGWTGMRDFIGEAIPPDLGWSTVVKPGIDAALVTLYTAILGTALCVPASMFVAVLGARTTTPNAAVYQGARSVMSALRAVPDVVFALIFVTAVGLGPFAGVLALFVHSIGVLGKLYSEAIEEIDAGAGDALRVAGASRTQIVVHAVLPTVLPTWIGLTLYRLDTNVRSSLVLGLVGAGGIGFLINQSIKLFRFQEMLTYILIMLVLIVVVDLISAWLRKRIAD